MLMLENNVNKSKSKKEAHLLKQPCHFRLHASAILYQVRYRASLLAAEMPYILYETDYAMQTLRCITLQIMQYGKILLRS